MSFSQYIDWGTELNQNFEKWENLGRQAIEEACHHKAEGNPNETAMRYSGYCDKCGHSEDSAEPMMNYGYPLETKPDQDKIIKVVNRTNCTVMCNTETDKHFIVLTGGGMDLSQDIALAYVILEKWIPFDLAIQVCTQPHLSVGSKDFRKMMRTVIESINNDIGHGKRQIQKAKESIKKSLQIDKERRG